MDPAPFGPQCPLVVQPGEGAVAFRPQAAHMVDHDPVEREHRVALAFVVAGRWSTLSCHSLNR